MPAYVCYWCRIISHLKYKKVTKKINDVVEEQTDIVTSLNIRSINNLLRRRQKLFIKQSNIYANFGGAIQIISYTLITTMLVYYVTNYDVTIGSVFSTYRYMFDFCNAVIGITYIIPEIINIKDVIRRLDDQNTKNKLKITCIITKMIYLCEK